MKYIIFPIDGIGVWEFSKAEDVFTFIKENGDGFRLVASQGSFCKFIEVFDMDPSYVESQLIRLSYSELQMPITGEYVAENFDIIFDGHGNVFDPHASPFRNGDILTVYAFDPEDMTFKVSTDENPDKWVPVDWVRVL